MCMLCKSIDRLTNNYKVVEFGEWCVFGSLSCHVDDTFLEAHDLTSCNNCAAAKYVCTSASHRSYLGDHSREHSTLTAYFYTGLDNVFNRHDTNALARSCDIKLNGFQVLVLKNKGFQLVGIHIDGTVFHLGFSSKLNVVNRNDS